ncbi:hypothetical protein OHA18_18000 [Kribbella sp. NBC_00709]|uniref:hypothetical protein n=1 Tax=Kribbella sp. NBC_00709 TaxID=2975972 RepID=UPI002E2E2B99|nr:hypothetical protein [Kribbella sp. NBC_00709]
MEITGLILTAIAAIAVPAAWIMFMRRRRAHGALEVREALIELEAATDEEQVVFLRDQGLLGGDGRHAMRKLRTAKATVVDKKLADLVCQVEKLYDEVEAAVEPSGSTPSPWEYAARHFDEHQPAKELQARIGEAMARASHLEKQRAGS